MKNSLWWRWILSLFVREWHFLIHLTIMNPFFKVNLVKRIKRNEHFTVVRYQYVKIRQKWPMFTNVAVFRDGTHNEITHHIWREYMYSECKIAWKWNCKGWGWLTWRVITLVLYVKGLVYERIALEYHGPYDQVSACLSPIGHNYA
jgi:hypothetical protein